MNHNKKIGKIKKQFMDFFFKETSEGYNGAVIDSKKHFGINVLCEEYAEEVLSQLNALDKPKICECRDITNIPIDKNGKCIECKKIRTKPRIDEGKLREYLWLSHGHYGLYGDDGEMQCSQCMLDFKRDSLDKIINRVVQVREKENMGKFFKCSTIYKPKIDIDDMATQLNVAGLHAYTNYKELGESAYEWNKFRRKIATNLKKYIDERIKGKG